MSGLGPRASRHRLSTSGRVLFNTPPRPLTVKNKRPFAELVDIPAGSESGADGLAIDRDDRIYITTVVGVQVFDASGKYLGRITTARQGANVAFAGPDKRTLYITAREGLYRIRMLAQGPDRLGK